MRRKQASDEAIALAQHNGGYLTLSQIEAIAAEPTSRLSMILVRCGAGRFLAPAQDVQHFIRIINEHKAFAEAAGEGDYVRDISLPSGFAVRGD